MTDCTVIMKDGKKYCGPMWEWKPKHGWFILVLDPTHYDWEIPDRIMLAEVESAVDKNVHVSMYKYEDVDLLKKALEDGWDGR